MIEACIIGISGYGRIHYDLLTAAQAAGKVDIVGAAIINQDEEQERCAHLRSMGCRIFDDYTVMLGELSGGAELCCIPTGTPLHRPMTVAALEAGMHVFVEKPVAGCLEDVRAMQEASEKAGRRVAVGYQQMYDPTTLELKRAILEGEIGSVEGMKCRVAWPRDSTYYNRNSWAGRLRVGETWVLDSPMNNAVAHDLMMMLFLAGPTERKAATPLAVTAELYRANDIESADTVCLRVETDTGIPLLFYATHACSRTVNPELQVRGTAGTIAWSHNAATIETPIGGKQELDKLEAGPLRKRMMQAALDMADGGTSFTCDLDVASMQTMVVSAAHQACEIQSVPNEQVPLDNGAVRMTIPGIEEVIESACEKETLFHDSGVHWAQPGGTFGRR
jgi:predicted dehydrogenase